MNEQSPEIREEGEDDKGCMLSIPVSHQLLLVFAFDEVSIGEGEGTAGAAGLMTICNGAGLGAGLVIELSPGVRGS